MFCKKCGVPLGENGICPKCGYVYEPMYKEYMDSWLEQGKTLGLPSMNSFAQPKTEMRTEEGKITQSENNNYQQPVQPINPYQQQPVYPYYQQNFNAQQSQEPKKSAFSWRAWFAPATIVAYIVVNLLFTMVVTPIFDEIYFDAYRDGYDSAYLSSINGFYNIAMTCMQLIVLPLLSVILFNLAFIKVDKKKKKACSVLILAPIACEWAVVSLSKIVSNVLTMWQNVGMIGPVEASFVKGIFVLALYIIVMISVFFICKSALKKMEKSWQQ